MSDADTADMLVRLVAAASIIPGVAVAAADPTAPAEGLFPEEEAAITRAVEKRRREFAAGRRAAREAMAALGHAPMVIPMGADRAPCWPAGLVGSISHTENACLVAVAPADEFVSLGLDIEPDADLDPDLWPEICTPAELAWLNTRPIHERGRLARMIFSAKEAAYKAQYPLTRRLLAFVDITLTPNLEDGLFTARLPEGQLAGGTITAAGVRLSIVFTESDQTG